MDNLWGNLFGHVQITNFNLPGYNFISQPSISNAAGVGFCVNSSLMISVRHDLSITTRDFEFLWIEIQSNLNKIKFVVFCTGTLMGIHNHFSTMSNVLLIELIMKTNFAFSWVTLI